MRAYRLLVLTYHWPPFTGAGAGRWTAQVKYLRRLGYEVTVVTTSAFGRLPTDADDGVVRTRDLATMRSLRSLLRRPPLGTDDGGGPAIEKPAPGLLTRFLVPDAYAASWMPFALGAVRRLLRERSFDCLITSSPPDSVHLAGLALGRHRPAWIAELRDGWTFEPLRPRFPTGLQRRVDSRLERAVGRRADAIVGATQPISADLERRLGVPVRTILNAWDPDLETEIETAAPPALEPDRVNLVYTGSLGGIRGHDDRGLLAALRELVREEPALVKQLRLLIAGPLTEAERRELSAPDLSPVVRTVGVLPRPEALALQRNASALLLITSHDVSIATAKLFEYLAADRPILALAGSNEAAQIVAETGTGEIVAPEDVPGIRRALAQIVSGELDRRYNPQGLGHYRYPAPAEALAETIGRAVDHHTRGG